MKDITCITCGKSDYHENPGPYFIIPFRGWFCSIVCWMKHIKNFELEKEP